VDENGGMTAEQAAARLREMRRPAETVSRNWALGDLAGSVPAGYGDETIRRLAEDAGVGEGSLANFRTVAAAYPASEIKRDLQSWTVYGIFASQDDRYELVRDGDDGRPWTVAAARELVRSRRKRGKRRS
jgi:hypothetical protein